jgi:hypothetical protein
MQGGTDAISQLLLGYHVHSALAYALAVTGRAAAKPASERFLAPGELDVAMHMLQEAALLMHAALAANPLATYTAQHAKTIADVRDVLDDAQALSQQAALDAVSLPELELATERARCEPRAAAVPPEVHPDVGAPCDRAVAVAALAPLPCTPDVADADVGTAAKQLLDWAQRCRICPGGRAHALTVVQEWLQARALDGFEAPALSKAELQAVCALAEEHRRCLHKLQHSVQQPALAVKLQSMAALVSWTVLCLAHRAAAAEWPPLREYSLPVAADDLRRLVLSDARATDAALCVAEYVATHTSTGGAVLTSEPGHATWQLAEQYVAESAAMCALVEREGELAAAREAAHWDAVDAKWARLKELDAQLAAAWQEKAAALAAEQESYSALVDARDKANSAFDDAKAKLETAKAAKLTEHREQQAQLQVANNAHHAGFGGQAPAELPASVLQALPEFQAHSDAEAKCQVLQLDVNSACSKAGKDSRIGAPHMYTDPGKAWGAKRDAFVDLYLTVERLKTDIAATEQPPADVFHTVPSTRRTLAAAQQVLFFMHPEQAGCMPMLAQACFDAAQSVLAPESCETTEPPPHRWAAHYNRLHTKCPFVKAPDMLASKPGDDLHSWVLLGTTNKAPTHAPRPDNVRKFVKGDGVWYPGLNRHLLWHGGAVLRAKVPPKHAVPPINPFPGRSVEVQAAALAHFTAGRPEWLTSPAARASRLTTAGGARPALQDAPRAELAARGSRLLTARPPARLTQAQWRALAGLRAHPLTQLPQL